MRTKILLTAAAAMVAGLVSSSAQVYSANIVGYLTYVTQTNAPGYELYCLPLDTGSNTLKNIFPTAPAATQVITWQNGGYLVATWSTGGGGHWKTNTVIADNMLITPGTGFFIQAPSKFTNTFVGSVTPFTGVSNTTTLAAGYDLIGSSVPFGDLVTNTSTLNLTNVAAATTITEWNPATQAFAVYTWSTGGGGHWKLNGVNNTPTLAPGQGFFFNSGSTYNWVQTGP